MEQQVKRPLIGVGVIIRRDGKVLLGLRKGSHGQGSWAFPGGHLEFGESIEQTAVREIKEETGLNISNIQSVTFSNDIFLHEHKHYVTLFVTADCGTQEPELLEPEKCEQWQWFRWDDLPEPQFLPLQHLLEQGYDPFRT